MERKMKKVLGVLLVLASISQASAGFIGKSLTADFIYTDSYGSTVTPNGSEIVGSGLEWDLNSPTMKIDADDNSITLDGQFGFFGDFAGWSFTDTFNQIDDIVGLTVDASVTSLSGFDDSYLSFTKDSIFLNFAGLYSEKPVTAKVNVVFAPTTPVPEPSGIFLFSLGLLGLAFSRRKA
jgi:hypothetical protein